MEEKIYVLEELEDKLKTSVRAIREFIKAGQLKASKVGKRYIVTETSLQEFLAKRVVQVKSSGRVVGQKMTKKVKE